MKFVLKSVAYFGRSKRKRIKTYLNFSKNIMYLCFSAAGPLLEDQISVCEISQVTTIVKILSQGPIPLHTNNLYPSIVKVNGAK